MAKGSKTYTTDQLARIEMISEDLKKSNTLNGKGVLTIADFRKKLGQYISKHKKKLDHSHKIMSII
jgi:hypothetical protein